MVDMNENKAFVVNQYEVPLNILNQGQASLPDRFFFLHLRLILGVFNEIISKLCRV